MPEDGALDVQEEDAALDVSERVASEALLVDVEGFEGPLDLLLVLARTQKVDLRKVSILQLAEQYLAFVEAAKKLRLELAADYLVMAAWLAFLKSRLLLPADPTEEGPSGEDLAAHLAFQLERLEAMRGAAAKLMARDQKGREFFARGQSTDVGEKRVVEWGAGMRALIGETIEWASISSFLPEGWQVDPKRRRSAMASSFAASLELAKRGEIELKQERVFAPVLVRKKASAHV